MQKLSVCSPKNLHFSSRFLDSYSCFFIQIITTKKSVLGTANKQIGVGKNAFHLNAFSKSTGFLQMRFYAVDFQTQEKIKEAKQFSTSFPPKTTLISP